ncbi:MAG: hypothetical protein ACRCZF_15730, partial [Gemmataceae bacterium]
MYETLEEYNAQSCCCPLPLCPIPTEICESLSGFLSPDGPFDPEEEIWKVYTSVTYSVTASESITTRFVAPGQPHDGDVSSIFTTSLNAAYTASQDINYDGGVYFGIGQGVPGPNLSCPSFNPIALPIECSAVGAADYKYYSTDGELSSKNEYSISDAAGTETVQHGEWVTEFTDPAGLLTPQEYRAEKLAEWEPINAAWNTWSGLNVTYGTWLEVKSQHDIWEADPGAYGPEPPLEGPEPTAPGTEPPNPLEPAAEPTEFYPDCWYKVTETFTLFGDPNEVDTIETFWEWSSLSTGFPFGPSPSRDVVYSNGSTWEAWLAEANSVLNQNMGWNQNCKASECSSLYYAKIGVQGVDVYQGVLQKRKARVRFRIPSSVGLMNDPDYVAPVPNEPPEPIPQVP